MATRLYPGRLTAAAVSPAFDASWEVTTSAARRRLALTAAAFAEGYSSLVSDVGSGVNPNDVLRLQWVSDPIAAQTITGTFKGQMRASELNAALNARAQVVVRVVSNDGTTVRGTLVASDASALSSEFTTGLVNRKFPLAAVSPVTVSSVTAQAGDRIVIEAGARIHSTDVTNTFSLRVGTTGTDLPEDETQATEGIPWFEFSQTISWYLAASAGVATATGAALSSTPSPAPVAGSAAGTAAALAPAPALATTAGSAAAIGTGLSPTAGVGIPAGVSSAIAAALAPSAGLGPTAGPAAATGAAYDPSAAVSATAGTSSAVGAALGPSPGVGAGAELASATGAALPPSVHVQVHAGVATATAAAPDPTARRLVEPTTHSYGYAT